MIKVNDNSMIKAGIVKNDLAIIEKTHTVMNGEIALIFANKNMAIRRYFSENNCIRLHAENNELEDLKLKQCKILGKLLGIYSVYL